MRGTYSILLLTAAMALDLPHHGAEDMHKASIILPLPETPPGGWQSFSFPAEPPADEPVEDEPGQTADYLDTPYLLSPETFAARCFHGIDPESVKGRCMIGGAYETYNLWWHQKHPR